MSTATTEIGGAEDIGAAQAHLRIGEAAELAGVSCRTLRYYQEIGLLSPAGTSPGGARRYSDVDIARVQRIRHLQELLGFNLTEIRTVLATEDRFESIRQEYAESDDADRHAQLLLEALTLSEELQAHVRAKLGRLSDFLTGLEEGADRARVRLATLHEPG
jgi:DNA-binding transcriptional MerR regulator